MQPKNWAPVKSEYLSHNVADDDDGYFHKPGWKNDDHRKAFVALNWSACQFTTFLGSVRLFFGFVTRKKNQKHHEGRTVGVTSGSNFCSRFAWPHQPWRMSDVHESKRAACAGRSRFHSTFSQIPQSWKRDHCRAFPSPLRVGKRVRAFMETTHLLCGNLVGMYDGMHISISLLIVKLSSRPFVGESSHLGP